MPLKLDRTCARPPALYYISLRGPADLIPASISRPQVKVTVDLTQGHAKIFSVLPAFVQPCESIARPVSRMSLRHAVFVHSTPYCHFPSLARGPCAGLAPPVRTPRRPGAVRTPDSGDSCCNGIRMEASMIEEEEEGLCQCLDFTVRCMMGCARTLGRQE